MCTRSLYIYRNLMCLLAVLFQLDGVFGPASKTIDIQKSIFPILRPVFTEYLNSPQCRERPAASSISHPLILIYTRIFFFLFSELNSVKKNRWAG